MEMKTFSISQLAREFSITPRAIRFYEDKGLLSPARQGQTRVFNARDRARLILILRGKRFGFALADIKEMLDLYEKPDGGISQLELTLDKARRRIARMTEQKDELDAAITDLTKSCERVETRLTELKQDVRTAAE